MANAPTIDPLTNHQKEVLRDDLEAVQEDSEYAVSITYKRFDGTSSLDLEAGTVTRDSTNDSITAIRRDVTRREVEHSGGRLQIGDRKYRIQKDDLTKEPTVKDVIVEDSVAREVIEWEGMAIGDFYLVVARKT